MTEQDQDQAQAQAQAQEHTRSALILYGTETGTSQDLAEEVGRTLERLRFDTTVLGLDAVPYTHLHAYSFTVFVVATTGQGDFPGNARLFWTSLLRRKLSPSTLQDVRYALVGVGDSSYPKFNFAARKLDKRLRQLGAAEMLPPCEADEQGDEGTEGAFLAWLALLREKVLTMLPLGEGQEPIPEDVVLPGKWRLEVVPRDGERDGGRAGRTTSPERDVNANVNGTASHAHHPAEDSFPVVLDVNRRVTPPEHWQDVRFMSLRTSRKIDYLPGDALAISPRNMPSDVDGLIARMNWQHIADTTIRLVPTRSHPSSLASTLLSANPIFAREDLTLRTLLTEYLDINAIPRRSFLGSIAHHTSDSMHRDRLLEFTDPQYLDEYYDYATRPRRSILEILQEFDSVHIPWEEVTNIFPPMRPRQFSIASGGRLKVADKDDGGATKFELLVAIVKYKTVIKRVREGVCTRYLAQLPVNTTLHVSVKREGRFSKASDPAPAGMSHILIGAGTGIAPLRALIHEKITQQQQQGSKTLLFFGCRNETADYFFQDEWAAIRREHPDALEVIPAFSRDQNSKVYVQDRLRQRSDIIAEYLMERSATVIVCGSSGQMPKAVRQALVDALVEHAQKSHEHRDLIANTEDADAYLARLEKENRYKQETWS
ncbi:NADPH-dependent diflavin oxidoreductase [Cladophialophora carrionii]|uniref:NADPH-dependent diflavin oxidoreductase 1 n=1 Tax=Cladophialophora carrionii TaxID=86049 RepID=A0A1C1D2E3_9EURO|nr:NADPH-dependent diflavin oxidoreductase [Cladophialophora carrionii]